MKNNEPIISKINQFSALLKNKQKEYSKTISEFFYGITAYEIELEFNKEKNKLNNLLMLMIFGDLAGLPFFPSYYSMRILPHIIPILNKWKRSIHREKDITDILSTDI